MRSPGKACGDVPGKPRHIRAKKSESVCPGTGSDFSRHLVKGRNVDVQRDQDVRTGRKTGQRCLDPTNQVGRFLQQNHFSFVIFLYWLGLQPTDFSNSLEKWAVSE